jgi:hypothetical protein
MSVAILWVLALPAALPSDKGPRATHGTDQRIAHIEAALLCVRETPAESRGHAYEYARVLEQGTCASAVERLKVDCLITAARRYCRRRPAAEIQRCAMVMDVVVSNVLAGQRLIPAEKRYEIMRRSRDYKREIAEELRRLQGGLAVDFRLRNPESASDAALASSIDRFCSETADDTNLAWQACASSLVWFIATSER